MNQKFMKFVFLILIFQNVDSLDKDELLGDKSIIRKLRNNFGSFKTEVQVIGEIRQRYSVKEQYSFKSKNGEIRYSLFGNEIWSWFNDFELFYEIYFKRCFTINHENLMKLNLRYWIPDSLIQIPPKFKMIGPSYSLFFLIDHYDKDKESVKCENIDNNKITRCDVFGDEAKLEYYFNNNGDMKMFPIKFKSFTNEFGFYKEINYTKFDYSFNGDDYNVDFKIPIGIGCRIEDKNNKYPKEETELGEQFKIEYDAELEYLDLETKDKDVYLKTQLKSQKLFLDTNFSFSILDRIDEETNKNIRTYFDAETKLAYDVYDDKCIKYNLKDGYKQNWINTLYNIKYLPDYLFATSKFWISYLGKHKLDKIYRVFEDKRYNFFRPKRGESFYRKPLSSVITHYFSEKDKKIPSLIEVRLKDIGDDLLGFLKIKINKYNLASSSDTFNEKINLDQCFKNLKSTTDYKELNVKFYGNLESFNDDYIKYEFRKSIDRDPNGYPTRDPTRNIDRNLIRDANSNIIRPQFRDANSNIIRPQFRDANSNIIRPQFRDSTIDQRFRNNLVYSPLRVHDIKLERKNILIHLNAKLLEPIDLNYFTIDKGVTFDESKVRSDGIHKIDVIKFENINNEESCARLCIQNSRCSAYSFKKQDKICKLRLEWLIFIGDVDNILSNFSSNLDEFNWSKLKTKSDANSIIGRKMIKFYTREHLSTNYTLDLIDKLIKKKEFNLILKKSINDKEIKFNQSMKSIPNENNLIPYLLYSILLVLVISGIIFTIVKYQKRNFKNNSSRFF